MTPEFKSRRKSAPELVEEARAECAAKGPDVDRVIAALKAGQTVEIRLAPIPPRHSATGIGE
ncbi:MAG: hypothetical protein KDJ98_08190 [Rhodobacteraceae bacterium]|nr:hypothetical protein [Paracoccaceae bacterium]